MRLFLKIGAGVAAILVAWVLWINTGRGEPLTIFVHIPKTAGETFKRNVEASYSSGRLLRTSFNHCEAYYDIATKRVQFYKDFDHFKSMVLALSEKKRKKIRFIGGHDSYYGIHKLFGKTPRYITFVREPVARTLSLYNFEKMAWEIYSQKTLANPLEKAIFQRLKEHFLIEGQVPDFETWLDVAYDKKTPFYYSMTRYLHHLGFSTALEQFSFIGITELHDDEAPFLYHELGIKRFDADKNASLPFVTREQLERRVLEKIREKNAADFQLYQLALLKNRAFKKAHSTCQ